MKFNFSTKFFLMMTSMMMLFMFFGNPLMAQVAVDTTGLADGPYPDGVSLPAMVNQFQVVYAALAILWGFVAKPLGLKGDKVPFIAVVLAGGVVLAVVGVSFGFGTIWQYIFPFLSAIGVYEIIFNGGKKTIAIMNKEGESNVIINQGKKNV